MSQTEEPIVGVKQAISAAKDYVRETFSDDGIENLALEEIKLDLDARLWRVTIGFSRPWERGVQEFRDAGVGGFQMKLEELRNLLNRTYKVVTVSALDGSVRAVENRPV